jgi:hypothetical protein
MSPDAQESSKKQNKRASSRFAHDVSHQRAHRRPLLPARHAKRANLSAYGFIAWASDSEPDEQSIRQAVGRWFVRSCTTKETLLILQLRSSVPGSAA